MQSNFFFVEFKLLKNFISFFSSKLLYFLSIPVKFLIPFFFKHLRKPPSPHQNLINQNFFLNNDITCSAFLWLITLPLNFFFVFFKKNFTIK